MEVQKVLDAQARAFEEFKSTNDARIAAIEKGQSTADFDTKLAKINGDMAELSTQLKAIQAAAQRAGSQAGEDEAKQRDREARQSFVKFMRTGQAEEKAMTTRDDPNGGYFVPQSVTGPIITRIQSLSPIRSIANVQTVSKGNVVEGLIDYGTSEVEYLDAEVTDADNSDTPEVKKYRIEAYGMRSAPKVSGFLLDDAEYDVEGWLIGKLGRDFAIAEGRDNCIGAGSGRARGFTTYTTAATADGSRSWGQLEHVATGTSGGFGATSNGSDKLIELAHKLKAGYRSNAKWVMSAATLGEARKLKDGSGQYIWLPNMQAGQPSTLLGYGVVEAEDMPAMGANSLSIAFGDFKEGYMIVDRKGLTVQRDPFTVHPFVKFSTVRRVGGGVVNFDAIKFLKFI